MKSTEKINGSAANAELSKNETKYIKRLDLLALVISTVLVLVLAGIVWYQFEGLLFKGIIVLFLMVLLCPEYIAMIAMLMGALLEFMGTTTGKSSEGTNVIKSFAVVIALTVAIIVLCVIAIWRNPPNPVPSRSQSSKMEWTKQMLF